MNIISTHLQAVQISNYGLKLDLYFIISFIFIIFPCYANSSSPFNLKQVEFELQRGVEEGVITLEGKKIFLQSLECFNLKWESSFEKVHFRETSKDLEVPQTPQEILKLFWKFFSDDQFKEKFLRKISSGGTGLTGLDDEKKIILFLGKILLASLRPGVAHAPTHDGYGHFF